MDHLDLFTDGSVNTLSKTGYGAYLALSEAGSTPESLISMVTVKRFENTSSTKLELQTLLWALDEVKALGRRVVVYTDSQNIIRLPERRLRFEKNGYYTRSKKLIVHSELYQAFYNITDQMDCEFVKMQGHLATNRKEYINRLFNLVDKASRKALREDYR